MGLREGGGNCLKYLKRGRNRKEGRGKQKFEKGEESWFKGWCLKKVGAGTPLQTMGRRLKG